MPPPPPPHPRPRPRTPIALSPLPSTAFLSFILRHHAPPTTLIICSTRDAFLQELHSAIVSDSARHRPRHHHPTSANSSNDDDDDDDEPPPSSHNNNNNNNPAPFPTPPPPIHPLLTPTIHLIAKSRSVTLAFTPTLPHLRAYIAAYTPTPNAPPPTQTPPPPAKTAPTAPTPIAKTSPPNNTKHNPKSGSHYPILAIWRLATLHRSTAEHSAQGLSRTLAAAVESAEMGGVRLVLGEGEGDGDGGVVGGVQDGGNEDEDENEVGGGGRDAWKEQVPVLSGSVRFGGEEREWAGRTVEVGRVVGRWCRFVRVGEGDGEGG